MCKYYYVKQYRLCVLFIGLIESLDKMMSVNYQDAL